MKYKNWLTEWIDTCIKPFMKERTIACKNEDKAKAKKMLINYVIGLVIIFVILVACPYLVRGIASLVT